MLCEARLWIFKTEAASSLASLHYTRNTSLANHFLAKKKTKTTKPPQKTKNQTKPKLKLPGATWLVLISEIWVEVINFQIIALEGNVYFL